MTPPICRRQRTPLKKTKGNYSARGAAIGARTVKSGQSRWFIGYKKHSLRLWIPRHDGTVLLVPLVSWIAPANRGDALFLEPSIRYCNEHLGFVPELVVADMAYINFEAQRRLREKFHVGVVTKLRPDFDLAKEIELGLTMRCSQGQKLEWLGLHEREQLHWFGVRQEQPLCSRCWQQSQCPREFSFSPDQHETVFGTIPVNSMVGKRLLRQSRSWIEASQAYDKNQLGLGEMFLNSLRLSWVVGLLADTVCLLRAHALLRQPPKTELLSQLLPKQMKFEWR